MQTPDEAMRQEIACPTCQGRLRVPVVEVGRVAAPASEGGESLDALDFTGAASGTGVAAAIADPMSATTAADEGSPTSRGSRRGGRRSRRRGQTPWGLYATIALLVLALAGLWFAFGRAQPELTGTLTAKPSEASEFTGTIVLDSLPLPRRQPLLDEVARQPVRFSTPLLTVEVTAGDDALEYRVSPTDEAKVVVVDPANETDGEATLAAWTAANEASLAAAAASELQQTRSRMLNEAAGEAVRPNVLASYLNDAFLRGGTRGWGSAVVANVAGTALPPVVQEPDGRLQLIIGRDVTLFDLVADPRSDRLPQPFRYRVVVE